MFAKVYTTKPSRGGECRANEKKIKREPRKKGDLTAPTECKANLSIPPFIQL